MDMFKDFDHYDSPVGLDGTPYTYFEELRDWAVEEDKHNRLMNLFDAGSGTRLEG